MIKIAILVVGLYLVCSDLAADDQQRSLFFLGRVVPISASTHVPPFEHSLEAHYGMGLHVDKILAGDIGLKEGREYVFAVHSIIETFHGESLKDVEGQEFTWLLVVTMSGERASVASIYRGEKLYAEWKKDVGNKSEVAPAPKK